MTNGAEGDVLVDTSNPPTNLTEYVISLFPLIDPITAQTIVQQYKNDLTLTDVFSQASAIMAECKPQLPSRTVRSLKRHARSNHCVSDIYAIGSIRGPCVQGAFSFAISHFNTRLRSII